MTVSDMRCDQCGIFVAGPEETEDGRGGVRFVYHPGRPQLRDTSGLLCVRCWNEVETWLGAQRRPLLCAVCDEPLQREHSLHVHRFDEARVRRLCKEHAVEFLNRLRTVEPKLDATTFRFP